MENLTRSFEAKVDDVIKSKRTVVSIIGSDEIDRFNSVFSMRGAKLDNYRKNPVVLNEHGKDPRRGRDPVGRNQWITYDKGGAITRLKAQTEFMADDFSQQRYEMYRDGFLSAFSIGANPDFTQCGPATRAEIKENPELGEGIYTEFGGGRGVFMYRSWELTEYSTTSVPGNASALTMERAGKLMACVERGLWVPDDVLTICRTMTDSQGGIGGGGAAVIGDEAPQRTKVGPKHAELGKGELCPEGECERCDGQRSERTLTITEADGSWHVMRGDTRYMSFRERATAEECVRIMLHGKPLDLSQRIKACVDEVRREGADMKELTRQYVDLYTKGRI